MPTGSSYIDSMHPDYTVVAETLNRTAYEAAVAAGIDVGELNRWQVNKAGDGLVFSNEKSGFSMRYLGPWLLMNGRRLLPYALILVSLLAILLLLLKSPLKKEDING